jgi:hypothetical protein
VIFCFFQQAQIPGLLLFRHINQCCGLGVDSLCETIAVCVNIVGDSGARCEATKVRATVPNPLRYQVHPEALKPARLPHTSIRLYRCIQPLFQCDVHPLVRGRPTENIVP